MPDKRSKNEFGVDSAVLKSIDWNLASARVLFDMRSDFIYAPHISSVFRHSVDALIDAVESDLKNGRFAPGRPITIEVPKSSRMQVLPRGSRGPSFSRPGSILFPKDRLLYEMLADYAAPLIEDNTDRDRSFSHQLAKANSPEMFKSSRACWNQLQGTLNRLSKEHDKGYVIKADIGNCLERAA